jgi:hypothetical protein
MLLGLLLVGAAGLGAELVLLEHTESGWQWVPLVLLGAVLVLGLAVAMRPARGTVRAFQGVTALCVAAGLLGVYLHLEGNVEFELEGDPSLGGLVLLWEALRGATPALAPGSLAQLGLLGLVCTYRHPALRRTVPSSTRPTETR